MPHKTLPEIAKITGLKDGQSFHHFLRDGMWKVEQARVIRLHLIRQQIGTRSISLCIDERDVKKGNTTDYVAKQYIGNLNKTANGIVSVNACAVIDGITYPLLFKIYKPKSRLKDICGLDSLQNSLNFQVAGKFTLFLCFQSLF
ncbi:MAG: transposase [Stenomitos rutilans HA7619-LM2]|nr:transposase [Stenomitos rutilans HA7619-LM2]